MHDQNSKAQAILYDIDGTLINLREVWEQVFTELYQREFGFTLTADELKNMFGPPQLESHGVVLRGRDRYSTDVAMVLIDKTEIAMHNYLSTHSILNKVIHGVHDCLWNLRDIPRTIVTGNIESVATAILRGSGIGSYFSMISCATPATTRRVEIVNEGIQKLERFFGVVYDRSQVYCVGDTPSDVKAALEAGVVPVAVTTGSYSAENLRSAGANIILSDLRGLPGLLRSQK